MGTRSTEALRRRPTIRDPIRASGPATDEFSVLDDSERGDYFLAAGEFVRYKRFDIAIDAFNELGLKLVVIGDGDERKALEKRAGSNIEFLGRVPFSDLKAHFAQCRALIFPGEEDFGMIPVEVMASGRPVIAYGRGGALDTVVEGLSGRFVKDQSVEGFVEAVKGFRDEDFDPQAIRAHALKYSKPVFKQKILDLLRRNGVTPA